MSYRADFTSAESFTDQDVSTGFSQVWLSSGTRSESKQKLMWCVAFGFCLNMWEEMWIQTNDGDERTNSDI